MSSVLSYLKVPEPPLEVGAAALYPYSPALERKFSRVDTFGDAYSLCRVIHRGTEYAKVQVPRMCAPACDVDKRVWGAPIDVELVGFTPRPKQIPIIQQLDPLLEAKDSFILQAGTGIGKTVLANYMISKLKRTTLIIVDQDNIKNQWRKELKRWLGLKDEDIGTIQGDVCDVVGKPVVIAMVHSLCKPGRYPSWVYSLFGVVIADEVHVMAAESFSNAMWFLPGAIRIGLSATVERKDGREIAFISHIGTKRVVFEGAPLVPKVLVVRSSYKLPTRPKIKDGKPVRRPDGSMVMVQIPHNGGKTMHVNKLMAADHERNTMMGDFCGEAYKKGRNILVLSDLNEGHLPALKSACIAAGVPEKEIGFYVGGKTEAELDKASRKSVVLATFRMTAKAVDCPWWDTIVLATPHSDVRQAIGRILREYDGKVCGTDTKASGKVPIVYDLVDDDSPVFMGYFVARLAEYKNRGASLRGDLALIGKALKKVA